jgi:hypothetical protein
MNQPTVLNLTEISSQDDEFGPGPTPASFAPDAYVVLASDEILMPHETL